MGEGHSNESGNPLAEIVKHDDKTKADIHIFLTQGRGIVEGSKVTPTILKHPKLLFRKHYINELQMEPHQALG